MENTNVNYEAEEMTAEQATEDVEQFDEGYEPEFEEESGSGLRDGLILLGAAAGGALLHKGYVDLVKPKLEPVGAKIGEWRQERKAKREQKKLEKAEKKAAKEEAKVSENNKSETNGK